MNDRHKWHIGQGDQGSFYTALVGCRYAQGYRARNPILGSIVYQSLKMGPLQRRVACYNETRGKRYGCQSLRGVMTKGLTSHGRSEEHTSELQSLMRISYAVFCLQKKKNTTTNQYRNNNQKTHNPPHAINKEYLT